MTNKEVMQMALDAMTKSRPGVMGSLAEANWDKAIKALYTALAQPEQEPFAEVRVNKTGGNAGLSTRIVQLAEGNYPEGTKLYIAPPQREWKGLMAEERQECLRQGIDYGWAGIVDAVEAKLKEKNA